MSISGFASYTDNGVVQITSSYQNPYLFQKNRVADNQARTNLAGLQMIAIRPDIGQWMTVDGAFNLHNGAGEVYVFSTQPQTSRGGFGLQVFTSNGDIAYHSSDKPIRVVDFVTGFVSGGAGKEWSKTYPFDVAILFNRSEIAFVPVSANTGAIYKPHVSRTSGGKVSVCTKPAGGIAKLWDHPVVFSAHSDFLVIDVTNY